jgi:uncharacterized protein (DUF58 family)
MRRQLAFLALCSGFTARLGVTLSLSLLARGSGDRVGHVIPIALPLREAKQPRERAPCVRARDHIAPTTEARQRALIAEPG